MGNEWGSGFLYSGDILCMLNLSDFLDRQCIPIKNHIANFKLIKELIKRGINCHYTHIGCGELENLEKVVDPPSVSQIGIE